MSHSDLKFKWWAKVSHKSWSIHPSFSSFIEIFSESFFSIIYFRNVHSTIFLLLKLSSFWRDFRKFLLALCMLLNILSGLQVLFNLRWGLRMRKLLEVYIFTIQVEIFLLKYDIFIIKIMSWYNIIFSEYSWESSWETTFQNRAGEYSYLTIFRIQGRDSSQGVQHFFFTRIERLKIINNILCWNFKS